MIDLPILQMLSKNIKYGQADYKRQNNPCFCSAGERDAQKRPFLGEISFSILRYLSFNGRGPRSEEVNKIIAELKLD